jgi:hypothetical protein
MIKLKSKFETRNPKQYQNSNFQMLQILGGCLSPHLNR